LTHETEYVLVITGGGSAYYAAPRASESQSHRDFPRWASHTVCGREWTFLGAADGEPDLNWEPAIGPTCRTCLRIVTASLAPSVQDNRVQPLAAAMADSVRNAGFANCLEVPGDQAERLRRIVKGLLRDEGRSIRTFYFAEVGVLLVSQINREPDLARLTRVMSRVPSSDAVPLDDDHLVGRFNWHDWH
jgi:hypothetical protein